MEEVLEKIGVPEVLYHDNGGSWNSIEFRRWLNTHNQTNHNIHITTARRRNVQTIKHMMHTRLEGLGISKQTWIDIFTSVLNYLFGYISARITIKYFCVWVRHYLIYV